MGWGWENTDIINVDKGFSGLGKTDKKKGIHSVFPSNSTHLWEVNPPNSDTINRKRDISSGSNDTSDNYIKCY